MKRYSIYDPSGAFVTTALVEDDTDRPACSVEGWYDGAWYFDFADQTPKLKPEQPSPLHEFDYTTHTFVPSIALASGDSRQKRNQLLSASDWTQLPDVPLATKEAWATYRQALRDIASQPGYPFNIIWPQAPQ